MHAAVLQAGLSRQEVAQLKTYFCQQIFEIVALLKARLRVATTAASYFQRFYHLHSFLDHDPRLVAPACVYLAGGWPVLLVPLFPPPQNPIFVELEEPHEPRSLPRAHGVQGTLCKLQFATDSDSCACINHACCITWSTLQRR